MSVALKRRAAEAALALVEDGMRLGLGTGSTAAEFVRLLGARGFSGVCVATSRATEALALECGLKITAPEDVEALDLAVDGADEIDPHLNLIKGGGAALLREKIVAGAAARFVVIADATKRVARLGRFPLPIEVSPFGWRWTAARVASLAPEPPRLRRTPEGAPVVTDGGAWLIDCAFGEIDDPAALAQGLQAIPGVLEHGLFVGMTHAALVADEAGVTRLP